MALGPARRPPPVAATLQQKVERKCRAIARPKTIWSFVAATIAVVVAELKDWLSGSN